MHEHEEGHEHNFDDCVRCLRREVQQHRQRRDDQLSQLRDAMGDRDRLDRALTDEREAHERTKELLQGYLKQREAHKLIDVSDAPERVRILIAGVEHALHSARDMKRLPLTAAVLQLDAIVKRLEHALSGTTP